ncbi:multifunctional peptide synthetase [Streptomyces bingchenggensis BCW-1]|uniref:Multifunctional peptide synthetase n=1 Tax=Streptomyces bingchenggensis (strain BCW-1) TaxID=749414 RepID=D7BU00_STRBB|nr:multifunctional peptide synthetase [Streptomyces bingchenggensis BCW-1]
MVFDHITVDAPSVGLIMEELGQAYTDALDGRLRTAAPIGESPYFAYVRQQQERTNLPEEQEHTDFWGKYLAGMDVLASAPRKHPYSDDSPIRHSSCPLSFRADFIELVERRRVTPFAVLLSAYSLTLQHFLRSDDIVVSYPAVDWRRTEFDKVVGLFTDMMLFRCPPQAETSLQEYVREVQESLFTCLEHQGESLEKLWARMRVIAGGGAALPAMLSVNDLGTDPRLPGLDVERIPLIPRDGKSELLLAINISGTEVTGRLDFDPDVYAPATAQRLARAWETVLGQIVDGWDGAAREVELITEADRSLVLDTWNAPPGEVDPPHVPESFLRQAAAAPEKVALIDEGHEVTYGELERASRSLAARIAALGLPSGSVVALCLPRSARFVEAALAVLRCGLAFLPIDMEQPPRRRAFVLPPRGGGASRDRAEPCRTRRSAARGEAARPGRRRSRCPRRRVRRPAGGRRGPRLRHHDVRKHRAAQGGRRPAPCADQQPPVEAGRVRLPPGGPLLLQDAAHLRRVGVGVPRPAHRGRHAGGGASGRTPGPGVHARRDAAPRGDRGAVRPHPAQGPAGGGRVGRPPRAAPALRRWRGPRLLGRGSREKGLSCSGH